MNLKYGIILTCAKLAGTSFVKFIVCDVDLSPGLSERICTKPPGVMTTFVPESRSGLAKGIKETFSRK